MLNGRFWFSGPGWGQRFRVSNRPQSGAKAAVLPSPLWGARSRCSLRSIQTATATTPPPWRGKHLWVHRAPRVNSPAGEKYLHLLFIPSRPPPLPSAWEGSRADKQQPEAPGPEAEREQQGRRQGATLAGTVPDMLTASLCGHGQLQLPPGLQLPSRLEGVVSDL